MFFFIGAFGIQRRGFQWIKKQFERFLFCDYLCCAVRVCLRVFDWERSKHILKIESKVFSADKIAACCTFKLRTFSLERNL